MALALRASTCSKPGQITTDNIIILMCIIIMLLISL